MKIRRVIARDERDNVRSQLVGAPVVDDEVADRLVTAWAESRGLKAIELRMPDPGMQVTDILYLPGPYTVTKLHEVYEQARIASANADARMH